MAVNALPLLHKYVLSPEDDKDLTLAKLKYRLCVKEVCEVLINRAQEKGFEPSSQTTAVDDDSFHVNPTLKWEDSGIGTDESVSEDLRSPQHQDNIFRITEEPSINDISRQPDSISDEAFHPPASSFLSSPSTSSSDSCEESEETEKPSYLFSRNGENFDNGENNVERETFFENVHTDAKDSLAPIHISSSCFGNEVEEHLHEEGDEEMEEEDEESFVPVMSSTLESRMDESTSDDRSPVDNLTPPDDFMIQSQGDDSSISPRGINDRCTDVDEALRILLTRKEYPQINSRKAVSTWSWNAADIARGPQKVQTEGHSEQQESQAKRNSSNQLRATHERILIKDKKLADIYRKIKERDEEDQRMVKELLKKQTIPFAEPLPVVLPPKPSPPPPEPIETVRPAPVEKAVVADAKPKEDSSASASTSARKTLTRAEEPARKRKNGNVFQNVVHSLQRRFSTKRNRESTGAAS